MPEPEAASITSITMRQARLALLQTGLLDEVEAMISQAPRSVQIEWEYATVVDKTSALVQEIGLSLGLTAEQIDQMFIDAALL